MNKNMEIVTFGVYISVALLIGYKMYTMEDVPPAKDILKAIENGTEKAVLSQAIPDSAVSDN